MSTITQCLGAISPQNPTVPTCTISARRARPAARIAFVLALAAFGIGRSAGAEGPVQRYAIPAGSLEDALMEFAAQTDLKLIFKTDLIRSAHSAGLTGTLTPEQGVARLLEGTGIAYRFVDPNTVTIEPEAPADPLERLVAEAGRTMEYAGATEPAPKPKAPVGRSEYGPTALPEMTVTGSSSAYDTSYNPPNATTATKTDTPIMETPVSIQVVPRQVIQDQQAIRLDDITKNVSGVQRDFTFGNGYEGFTIRGFSTNITVYRNGFRLFASIAETAHLDRVEVLKGPAAVLYGRIEPGGLVNLVTKRPLPESYYSLQQQFGSFDLYRTTADATGPIREDRLLLYRLNLAYLNTDSFRDFVFNERVFFAPGLTWRPTQDDEFNLSVEYDNEDNYDDSGIPALGNRPAPLPSSRNLGEPDDKYNFESVLVDLNGSHRFNTDWNVRGGVVAYFYDYAWRETYSGPLQADNRTLDRNAWFVDGDRESQAVYLDLTGKCEIWGTEHNVLLGGDYYRQKDVGGGVDGPVPGITTIDIFNPVYGTIDHAALTTRMNTDPTNNSTNEDEWYGIYFQDQITLWDKLHILGGGRYDWATRTSGFSDVSVADAEANESEVEDAAFSPRVGLVYQPWPWVSLYGNYVESLGSANGGRSASGQPFEPETAQQYEAVFKTEWLDQRLTSTLAFYHLTKENVTTAYPNNPRFSVAIGEARSRGIELDIAGQVTDALSVIATYAYTDTEIIKDFGGNQGHRLPNAPLHSGSLWAKYELQQDLLQGLSLGAGVYLVGQREGDTANSFQLPGYGRVDAFAAYRFKLGPSRLTVQLNINNLLDKEYFKTAQGRPWIQVGEPLTVLGSLRVEF
ncbi:MAG: TonB-dependent siderophore receptor [Gammaproteobacteria bacterium]